MTDTARLEKMLRHADLLITARNPNGLLVGLSRAITDFHYCTYLSDLCVDEQYQRQGIGRLMMEYAISRSREAGCYKLQLASSKTRDEAHQFYKSLGFEASAHGFRLYF